MPCEVNLSFNRMLMLGKKCCKCIYVNFICAKGMYAASELTKCIFLTRCLFFCSWFALRGNQSFLPAIHTFAQIATRPGSLPIQAFFWIITISFTWILQIPVNQCLPNIPFHCKLKTYLFLGQYIFIQPWQFCFQFSHCIFFLHQHVIYLQTRDLIV